MNSDELSRQELEEGLRRSGYDLRLKKPEEEDYFAIFHHRDKKVRSIMDNEFLRYNSPALVQDRKKSVGDGRAEKVGFIFPSTRKFVILPYFMEGFPGQEFLEEIGYTRLSTSKDDKTDGFKILANRILERLTPRDYQ